MATTIISVPASPYWAAQAPGSGTTVSSARLRFQVEQNYDSAANKSTLTFTMQAYATSAGSSSGDPFRIYDGGSISLAGQSADVGGLRVKLHRDSTFRDFTSDGVTRTWTRTITHNADGTASVPISVNFTMWWRASSTSQLYAAKFEYSTTLSLSNTRSYKLTLAPGANSSISVKRGATNLSNGATIYQGDVLTISFVPSVGYKIATHTVNGTTFVSGGSHTVTGAVNVVSSATKLSYTLMFSSDSHSTVTVTRDGAPLASGSTIYYGDALTITATPQTGYKIATATINGASFTSPKSVNITGNITVAVTSAALGFAYILRSGTETPYLIYIRRSGAWVRYRAYIRRSGAWTAY